MRNSLNDIYFQVIEDSFGWSSCNLGVPSFKKRTNLGLSQRGRGGSSGVTNFKCKWPRILCDAKFLSASQTHATSNLNCVPCEKNSTNCNVKPGFSLIYYISVHLSPPYFRMGVHEDNFVFSTSNSILRHF